MGKYLLRSFLVATFSTVVAGSTAHAVTVYSQTFAAAGVPGEWAAQDGTAGLGTLGIADESAGIGSGNALSINSATRQGIIGSFAETSLMELGDSIELSFDIRLDSFPNNSGGFRFGLMQSESEGNSHGYRIAVGTGTNTPYTSANADGGDADILFGVNRDILRVNDDPGDTGGLNDTLSHSFALRLTSTLVDAEPGVAIEVLQDGVHSFSPEQVVHLESEPVGGGNQTAQVLQTTFDQIAFSTNGGITGFVDNVQVEYISADDQRSLTVNRDDGSIVFNNPLAAGGPINIIGYSLTSESGSLDQSGWKTVADNYDASGPPADQVDPDDEWTVLSNPSSHEDFSEAEFFGDGGSIGQGDDFVISEGGAWLQSPTEDIQLELLLDDGSKLTFPAVYEGNGGSAFDFGDLDFDGNIDADDYVVLRDNGLTNLSDLSPTEAYGKGDLNADGVNDLRDYAMLRNIFDSLGQSQAFLAAELNYGTAIPEPTSALLALVGLAGVLVSSLRVPMRRLAVAAVATSLCLVGTAAFAVVAPFTSSTFDSVLDGNGDVVDTATLTSYTTAAGGVVSDLSHAIAGFGSFDVPSTGSTEVRNSWGVSGSEVDGVASLLDLDISTGILNGGDPTDSASVQIDVNGDVLGTGTGSPMFFMFSQDVSSGLAGNANDFFLVENGGNDAIIIKPLNASGVAIGDFSLTIESDTSWGTSFTGGAGYARVGDNVTAGTVANFGGLAFDVEDFSGTGTLTGMMGISIEGTDLPSGSGTLGGTGGLDALVIGVNSELAPIPEPTIITAEINLLNGSVKLRNKSPNPIEFSGYQLTSSTVDTLDFANWNSMSDQNLNPVDDGLDPGETWDEVTGSNNSILGEQFFLGSSTIASAPINLGQAYNESVAGDLIFEYFDVASGEVVEGLIEFVSIAGLQGDYNDDGIVNLADYTVWRDNLGSADESSLNGNGSGGGGVGPEDYALWKSNFGSTSGSFSAVTTAPIPEPRTALMLLMAVVAAVTLRKPIRLTRASAPLAAALLAACFATNALATITLEGHYELGDLTDEMNFESVGNNVDIENTYDTLSPLNDLTLPSGDPLYASLTSLPYSTGKPVAAGNWGANFDGDGDSIQLESAGNLTVLGGGADVGASLWVYPRGSANRQAIYFNDVNNVGTAITASGQWTQIISSHTNDTDIPSGVDVVLDEWTHIMQHTYVTGAAGAPALVPGTTDGSDDFTTVLYVNGVPVSAHTDNHSPTANTALLLGAENPGTPSNSFNGVIGEAKFYNTSDFSLFTDNESLVDQIAVLSSNVITDGNVQAGDVDVDGDVDGDDVNAFVAGWFSKNRIDGLHADLYVGSLSTWQQGDMNLDGQVNLDDVFLMNTALAPLGGFDFSLLPLGTQVPEPSSIALVCLAAFAGLASRRFPLR